jgi:hypothetical protein
MSILNISSQNKAILFLNNRIKDDKYRGAHYSQHNRYDFDRIEKILSLFDSFSPNLKLMKIRTTDISKRPENTADEALYAAFCDAAKLKCGIGTQDAMRKNIFVDLHRMGLIDRYKKDGQKLGPYERGQVKFASLTQTGLNFVNAIDLLQKYFIFTKSIDALLNGAINILLDLLRDDDFNLKSISINEYLFFISAIELNHDDFDFSLSREDAVDLIKNYRALTPIQRRSIVQTLREEMDPNNFMGDKTDKRDFHNWINEAQQVFMLLNQTVYFEVQKDNLVLKTGRDSVFEHDNRLNRSLSEKFEYFRNHNVEKTKGFELHHVVPLAWSESVQHFKLLDKWNNMVYIDAFSHAKITQNNNKNVHMTFLGQDMKLNDYNDNEVYLADKTNILYAHKHTKSLLDYNERLRNIEM